MTLPTATRSSNGARSRFWALLASLAFTASSVHVRGEFRAGAAVVDVTPTRLPVLVNGGMFSRSLSVVKTPVNARALVLADDHERLAIVVVDSCMMPRALLDDVKGLAQRRCGIATNRILISATHAHSAPSSMGCLGTDADPTYIPLLRDRIVQAIEKAQAQLEPARIGYARGNASDFTALRQWIRRPDRMEEDPFGNKTVRANMHAGRVWDDVTGEAGPKDPDLTLISVQARDGRPLAVLGNFSMHYFSDDDISADYFGLFSEGLQRRLAPTAVGGKPAFVGMMSHGCSGDIWRRDYTKPESAWNSKLRIEDYAAGLVDIAAKAYAGIRYREDVSLAMAERRVPLTYRVPNVQLLEWSRRVLAGMTNAQLSTTREVYAREQVLLHEAQRTEVVVQALRLGDILIATTPCETYAVTGLKIKAASPLPHSMVIELANGGDGYIPPPDQHLLGGYNTWPARSAGLEILAEPKIAEAAIELAEQVSGKPRRDGALEMGPATRAILKARPFSFWRLNEFGGPVANDATGQGHHGVFEPPICYFLEGPRSSAFCSATELNRAPHFVGGRLRTQIGSMGDRYTIHLWAWNGMPNQARGVAGWLYSRGPDHGLGASGEHLGVTGTNGIPGRLTYFTGSNERQAVMGRLEIPRWEWHSITLVRDRAEVRVYVDGELDLSTVAPLGGGVSNEMFFGGRSDQEAGWEGRLDEVAVFSRALSAAEVRKLMGK